LFKTWIRPLRKPLLALLVRQGVLVGQHRDDLPRRMLAAVT
jgi:hypothetical protein